MTHGPGHPGPFQFGEAVSDAAFALTDVKHKHMSQRMPWLRHGFNRFIRINGFFSEVHHLYRKNPVV
jgi:hypothetical protein